MRHLRRLLHCVAAGAVAGAAICPLQLLLWPGLDLGPGQALLAGAAWASWGALWFGAGAFLIVEAVAVFAHYIGTQRGVSVGLWRWLLAGHGALVAGVALWNRDHTRELLVEERRDALSVAGILIALLTIALLASAVRRRAVRHPLVTAATSGAAIVLAAWAAWGWAPAPPRPAPIPQPPAFAARQRLLLVAWEGADLPWLLPAIERGDMPFLRELREVGAWGQVRTVRPFSRTAALTTLATACTPAVHGVLGRKAYRLPWLSPAVTSLLLEGPWPVPHQLPWRAWQRAATPKPARAPLWEILQRAGLAVGLAGWPGVAQATWTVEPPLASEALPFDSLDAELRGALLPALEAHPDLAPPTRAAFAIAAQVGMAIALRHARDPVDALLVNVDLAARVRPSWTLDPASPSSGEVVGQAVRLLDEQLRELWSLVGGQDTLLVVVSPYGMAPPSPWRRLENMFGGGRRWRVSPTDSPDGFVLFAGPGVRAGARLSGCKLADVSATVLYLLHLPVARDMAGKVLLDAVDEERAATVPLRLIPSYPPTPRNSH